MKKHLQLIKSVTSAILLLSPLATFAISEDVFDILSYIINSTIVVLVGIATLIFMYGVILYVIAKGDEKQLASGKSYMLWGIVGLTAMVAVWGFVNLIIYTIFGSSTDPGLASPDVTPLRGTRTRGTSICIFGVCF